MKDVFEIAWTGQPRTNVADLSIRVGNLLLVNQGIDQLTLNRRWNLDDDGMGIPVRDIVTVWRNNVRIFSGPASSPVWNAEARDEQVTIFGGGFFLANSCYYDQYAGVGGVYPDDGAPTFATAYSRWQRCVNGVTYPYLTTQPPNLSDWISAPTEWPSYMPSALLEQLPFSDGSLLAMLEALLTWLPFGVATWDYSDAKPSLVLSNRNVTTKTLTSEVVADFTLDAQEHLTPEAVVLRTQLDFTADGGPAGYYYRRFGAGTISNELLSSPLATTAPAWKRLTLPVAERSFFSGDWPTWMTSGPLDYVLNALQGPFWRGEIVLKDGCNTVINVGDTINLTGYHTDFLTMGAVVQRIERHWLAGEQVLTVGPHEAVTANNLFSLWVAWANQRIKSGWTMPPKVV